MTSPLMNERGNIGVAVSGGTVKTPGKLYLSPQGQVEIVNIPNIISEGNQVSCRTNIKTPGNIYVSPHSQLEIEKFDVPCLINTFKGREKEMEELDSIFFVQKRKRVVVGGFPGFGKSELAKQYAHRCVENNNIYRAFWVPSVDYDYLCNFSKLKKIYKTFKGQRCLFIFDNAICRQDTIKYEPPDDDSFILLITSIETDWGKDLVPLKLDPLSPESAVNVYQSILKNKYQGIDRKLYEQLADIVGNVPLGLQVTGAYVRQQMMALDSKFNLELYIESLKGREDQFFDAPIPSCSSNSYQNSMYGAFKICLEKIETYSDIKLWKLARKILYLYSCLQPEFFNFDDVVNIFIFIETITKNREDILLFKRALCLLDNYNFVNFDPNKKTLHMNRYIQDLLRFHFVHKC